jgi:hypothetical protein
MSTASQSSIPPCRGVKRLGEVVRWSGMVSEVGVSSVRDEALERQTRTRRRRFARAASAGLHTYRWDS